MAAHDDTIDLRDVERLLHYRKERRLKDEERRKVVEEVFDYRTLLALHKLFSRGVLQRLHGVVAAGKEARVYWGVSPEGRDLAVKIFLVVTAEFRKSRLRYMMGDPRFRRIRRDPWNLIRTWCYKEYRNLKRAYRAGVSTPEPYTAYENILVMEFIDSGERGVPAPSLKITVPEDPESMYMQIRDEIRKIVAAGLVHADLSEYNILVKDGRAVIIDWGSAVLLSHPHAGDFLLHDIRTVFAYFQRLGVETEDPLVFYRSLLKDRKAE